MQTELIQLRTGITIEYSLIGPKDAPSIIFVHGLGPNLHQFEPQGDFFSQQYQVILISLRGHGRSSMPDHPAIKDFSVEQLAADIKALLFDLGIQKVHFVGNSLGGLVGYEMLRSDKEMITSLTTFGTTAELHTSSTAVWFLTSLTKILGPKNLGKMAGVSTKDKAVAGQISEMFSIANKDAIWMIQRNISNYDYTPVLAGRTLPVLLIKGQLDNEINAQLGSTLDVLHRNPKFQLRELDGVGHFVNLEKTQTFNQILLDFLTKVEAYQ